MRERRSKIHHLTNSRVGCRPERKMNCGWPSRFLVRIALPTGLNRALLGPQGKKAAEEGILGSKHGMRHVAKKKNNCWPMRPLFRVKARQRNKKAWRRNVGAAGLHSCFVNAGRGGEASGPPMDVLPREQRDAGPRDARRAVGGEESVGHRSTTHHGKLRTDMAELIERYVGIET